MSAVAFVAVCLHAASTWPIEVDALSRISYLVYHTYPVHTKLLVVVGFIVLVFCSMHAASSFYLSKEW